MKESRRNFIAAIFAQLAFYASFSEGKCPTYRNINNYQRSVAYLIDTTSKTASSRCDFMLISGWYRFTSKAGGKMPTTCPAQNACGTTAPVWAKGKIPDVIGSIQKFFACARWQARCEFQCWPAWVQKCKETKDKKVSFFFIYYLTDVPYCPMSYCAGEELPCKPGWNSITGFTPCTQTYPEITGNIKLTTVTGTNNRLRFKCTFKSDQKSRNSRFEITWYYTHSRGTTEIKYKHKIKGDEKRIGFLENSHATTGATAFFPLGTNVFCRVRSWFHQDDEASIIYSPFKESNHYYAGILIEPTKRQFKITEGDEKPLKLTVTATVPIICPNLVPSSKDCEIQVLLYQEGGEDFCSKCYLVLNENNRKVGKTVEVYAKRDFANNGNRIMHIKFKVKRSLHALDWSGRHEPIPSIQIITADVKTARCHSTGDPHLLTFDKLYYHLYQVGDYVLVKSSSRKFEVQVRTWRCASVACNCGVAAREGDDIIIVDMCKDGIPTARKASAPELAEGTFITRDKNGKSFMIDFPSGSFVRVNIHPWLGSWSYANVEVQVPSDDFRRTKGLCGNFDENAGNDMIGRGGHDYRSDWKEDVAPKKFLESWQLGVGSSENLFYHKGNEERKCNKTLKKHFCKCVMKDGNLVQNCDFTNIADRPSYIGYTKRVGFPDSYCGRRRRRSVSKSNSLPDDSDSMIYTYDPVPLPEVKTSWPTATGKTQIQVEAYCNKAVMESGPGLICKSIPDFDFRPFISQCVEDVKVTDDYSISSSAVLTMQSSCEEVFLTNVSYWQVDSAKNGSLGPPKAIAETLCPGLCSGNGRCVNATCICNSNFTSEDCSIEKNKGPTVTSIPLDGLCDVRKRSDCEKIRVNGRDFLDSEKLSCRSTEVQVSEEPYKKLSGVDTSRGYMLSYAQAMCQLKNNPVKITGDKTGSKGNPHAGYLLTVSNDGNVYSEKSPIYIIYDSKCMNCTTETGNCTFKNDSCIINGFCFASGESKPSDTCWVCDPSLNTTSFSFVSSCIFSSSSVLPTPSYNDTSLVATPGTLSVNASCQESSCADLGRTVTITPGYQEPFSVVATAKTSLAPGCQEGHCSGSDNKAKNDKLERKNNIIVISCSAVGGILVLLVVAVVVIKSKKKNAVKKRVAPAEHTNTFVNASYEG